MQQTRQAKRSNSAIRYSPNCVAVAAAAVDIDAHLNHRPPGILLNKLDSVPVSAMSAVSNIAGLGADGGRGKSRGTIRRFVATRASGVASKSLSCFLGCSRS